jgi:hypothetical protein
MGKGLHSTCCLRRRMQAGPWGRPCPRSENRDVNVLRHAPQCAERCPPFTMKNLLTALLFAASAIALPVHAASHAAAAPAAKAASAPKKDDKAKADKPKEAKPAAAAASAAKKDDKKK